MSSRDDWGVQAQVEALLESAGIPVAVSVERGTVTLIGPVSSPRIRQAAIDLAQSVDGVRRIDDQMEYEVVSPDTVYEEPDVDGEFAYSDDDVEDADLPDAALDLTDIPSDSADTADFQDAVDEGEPYFPPTDPVVQPGRRRPGLEVVGGFQGSSMDDDPDDELAGAPMDGDEIIIERDDETIRADVVRELREDALTTDLTLDVEVINGVVRLRGRLPSVDDAENAEAVAGRVSGVRDVEDLTVVDE